MLNGLFIFFKWFADKSFSDENVFVELAELLSFNGPFEVFLSLTLNVFNLGMLKRFGGVERNKLTSYLTQVEKRRSKESIKRKI